jgi:hypothetical protein
MPFTSEVVVRETGEQGWELVQSLVYLGNTDRFTVPAGFGTDFASVPSAFTWLLPRYGRYTKAAILHDWLCRQAREGGVSRDDVDGLFRRAMRELGVPFLKRWLMWAAVRAEAAKTFGLRELCRPSWRALPPFVLAAVLGLGCVLVPGVVIVLALAVFYLAEWASYLVLRVLRSRSGPADREANRPRFGWTL